MKLKLIKFNNVKSTNDEVIKLIKKNKFVPSIITAKNQTKGRGRMGRKWVSKEGNLFISLFLEIDSKSIKFDEFSILNPYIIKNILTKYSKYGISIKWPNDLLVKKRKLCGILQEVIEHKDRKFLIIGIGINTKISPKSKSFKSISLSACSNNVIKNNEILIKIKLAYEKIISNLKKNKNQMKYLVGDIGNTLTKITLLNERFKIIRSKSIDSKKLYKKNYLSIIFKGFLTSDLNNKILFSSVVPSAYRNIKHYLRKKSYRPYEIKELKVNKIIKLNVNNFKQVGSDRIVNAIGSYDFYKRDCLVIDFGTATTFDIVKKPGIYDGGVIAPGIKLSIVNLNKFTALLPVLNLKNNAKSYGKNTNEALNAGFLWGYEGLINNIIKKIVSAGKSNYKVILTGGYSKLFKKHISKKSIIDNDITTKGIIKVYKDLLL